MRVPHSVILSPPARSWSMIRAICTVFRHHHMDSRLAGGLFMIFRIANLNRTRVGLDPTLVSPAAIWPQDISGDRYPGLVHMRNAPLVGMYAAPLLAATRDRALDIGSLGTGVCLS